MNNNSNLEKDDENILTISKENSNKVYKIKKVKMIHNTQIIKNINYFHIIKSFLCSNIFMNILSQNL